MIVGTQYSPPTSDPLKFLGHDIRYKEGLLFENEHSSGYAYGHPYRDTILVPPLSNITVSSYNLFEEESSNFLNLEIQKVFCI